MSAADTHIRNEIAGVPTNVWLVGQHGPERQRQGRYSVESVRSHPGKMLPEIARRLIDGYTRVGDWILDPMSGIGTTGVEAVHLSRNYVGVELEPKFVRLQRENLEFAARNGASGKYSVLQGDARRLRCIGPQLEVPGLIDAVITSPPYGERLRRLRKPTRIMDDMIASGKMGRNILPGIYGTGTDNLGNLRDADYLQQIGGVYAGCFDVLKPGGILAVVIRPARHRDCLCPFHHYTARICVDLGFKFLDEVVAVLSRVEAGANLPTRLIAHSLLFKRLAVSHLRQRGCPVTLEQVEYVLVFQKPLVSSKPRFPV